MKQLNHFNLKEIAGGDSGFEFMADSHGQLELGVSYNDHQLQGMLVSESSFCPHADLKTEVSIRSDGHVSGYVGVNATW